MDAALRGLILGGVGLGWVVLIVRFTGLRSFSKMTSFDFVTTVALGSLLAGAAQASDLPAFVQSMVGIAGLFVFQFMISKGRKVSDNVEHVLANKPCILMRDGVINEAALSQTRVTRADLLAKLREANVMAFSEVRAVVLENTGDISVLHGKELDDDLLESIEEIEKDG
ncbi:hypothetical protein A6F65_01934 [Paraurantiacibacter namhicola]|uniref:YetF C-terminal domain-containing protein n=1 Tax=Paraurantiacibacter namhicola TaxID=645517 RepID=A0A1C7D9X1_9SPHN|nr:hypothetical protein A6F65_01934 [Paraurantiacibacter namhicola]